MNYKELQPANVLHWNYRGFTEFPLQKLNGEESEITDIYLKENLISQIPADICKFEHLESLYLSGNDIKELPKEISKLRCLKCLDVSGNRLRCIPDEIGEVGGLKFLILDENELSELPLRIAELRALRYLSVCDNQLQWLPQRPVYNYHHCEFRFWRNTTLNTIPYSLWYHMFREQQTRSLNIGVCVFLFFVCESDSHLADFYKAYKIEKFMGEFMNIQCSYHKLPIRNNPITKPCLSVLKYQQSSQHRCRLKINRGSREWDLAVDCPQYNNLLESSICSPPSLLEICKRVFYQMLSDTAKDLSDATDYFSIYTNNVTEHNRFYNRIGITNLEDNFGSFNIESNNNENIAYCDMNGNSWVPMSETKDFEIGSQIKRRNKSYYVAADIINDYYRFLPRFILQEFCNGPPSRCEYVDCKKPIFDYATYEFCIGKIILIDNVEDVILSAAFCSKSCSDAWKRGKTTSVSWSLTNYNNDNVTSIPVSSKR